MRILLATTALVTLVSYPVLADEYTYSPQLSQIKLDKAIQSYANYGKGITIAVVDTGLNPNHVELAGRVSAQSTCVATNNCWYGYQDTNFHGTFVASIAAGALNNYGMVGVAPSATILGIKIAQPNGSAIPSDENAGLLAAANRGAQVINLSYGSFFGPKTTSAYASYNNALVSTLNTVASKGTTTVIAGGNSSTTFMDNVNQGGFTSASLSRLLFVGSVNSANQLSSFSNTPGTTKFTTTDGKTVNLNSLWLMAPGENIIGAYYGMNNYYVQASGTSFSAPQVAGAVALLESRWPTLYKNGTAAKVLLTTATDLGAAGVDNIYGAGLMNLNKAFLPIGNLTISNSKGAQVNVTTITGSMITSGAFGSLATIKSKLGNIIAFDTYSRDFSVNLANLIQTKPTAATVVLPHGSQVVGSSYKFAEGGGLSYAEDVSTLPEYFRDKQADDRQKSFYLSMTDGEGTTTAGGYGFSATPSFAQALYGIDSGAAEDISALGLSNELLSLTQGGAFIAYGEQINSKTRYALSWSQTASQDEFLTSQDGETSSAHAVGLGLAHKMSDTWNLGFTLNYLGENNQYLGSTYANSAVSFGDHHNSLSLGVSSSFDLGNDRRLSFDAAVTRGSGANVSNSLIESVSDVYAESLGVTYSQDNAFKKGDAFSISLKQPMRVFSGSANMVTSGVDGNGDAVIGSEQVSLKPDGFETDLTVGYSAPLRENMNWTANVTAKHDDGNIAGNDTLGFRIGTKITF